MLKVCNNFAGDNYWARNLYPTFFLWSREVLFSFIVYYCFTMSSKFMKWSSLKSHFNTGILNPPLGKKEKKKKRGLSSVDRSKAGQYSFYFLFILFFSNEINSLLSSLKLPVVSYFICFNKFIIKNLESDCHAALLICSKLATSLRDYTMTPNCSWLDIIHEINFFLLGFEELG